MTMMQVMMLIVLRLSPALGSAQHTLNCLGSNITKLFNPNIGKDPIDMYPRSIGFNRTTNDCNSPNNWLPFGVPTKWDFLQIDASIGVDHYSHDGVTVYVPQDVVLENQGMEFSSDESDMAPAMVEVEAGGVVEFFVFKASELSDCNYTTSELTIGPTPVPTSVPTSAPSPAPTPSPTFVPTSVPSVDCGTSNPGSSIYRLWLYDTGGDGCVRACATSHAPTPFQAASNHITDT